MACLGGSPVGNMLLMAVATGLMLSACGNGAGNTAGNSANGAAPADLGAAPRRIAVPSESCADDGDRLPVTGLCAGRAVNHLDIVARELPDAPEGCRWVVQETPFAGQVLLYRALRCGDRTTRLAFAGGAGLAELSYDTIAWGDDQQLSKGQVLVRVGRSDKSDPTAALLATTRAAIETPAERAGCSVRNARIDGWPADALVVDVSAAEAAREPPDGPRFACGPFGFNGDESSYWRVFQGHSWFFQLGQDLEQIDAASFTLMAKNARGEWSRAE